MKVGVITHYYRSINYGGNLQAYALIRFLKKNGYDAEQISYDRLKIKEKATDFSIRKICSACKSVAHKLQKKFNSFVAKETIENIHLRNDAINCFNIESIPHSRVYDNSNIDSVAENYDVFITGSDQVWTPGAICEPYLLNFHKNGLIKISYAASIAVNTLSPGQLEYFKSRLSDYTAISVREENGVDLIKDVSPVAVEYVLDPTLLLSADEWNEICDKRVINDHYLFCFFLGDNENTRKLAMTYAKQEKLKIVNMPDLLGFYRKCDENFGDIKLYDISPKQFLSLIKYADCIFTDSFHATVFSGIFEKEYYTFQRSTNNSMSSRLYTIVNLFETEDRFCDSDKKCNIGYINSLPKIDYSRNLEELQAMKSKSVRFLLNNLKAAGEFIGKKS